MKCLLSCTMFICKYFLFSAGRRHSGCLRHPLKVLHSSGTPHIRVSVNFGECFPEDISGSNRPLWISTGALRELNNSPLNRTLSIFWNPWWTNRWPSKNIWMVVSIGTAFRMNVHYSTHLYFMMFSHFRFILSFASYFFRFITFGLSLLLVHHHF